MHTQLGQSTHASTPEKQYTISSILLESITINLGQLFQTIIVWWKKQQHQQQDNENIERRSCSSRRYFARPLGDRSRCGAWPSHTYLHRRSGHSTSQQSMFCHLYYSGTNSSAAIDGDPVLRKRGLPYPACPLLPSSVFLLSCYLPAVRLNRLLLLLLMLS